MRTLKADDPNETFVVPERIGQAGGEDTIYDQSGKVVFYEVRFSRNLCPPPTSGNLPAGTTEIKTSWRQIDPSQASRYFTNETVIQGVSTEPILLGLVGFHLFRTTAQHPEGVWMTWEHASNAPDCLQPQAAPSGGWSFASAQCLATSSTGPLGCASCNFNNAQPSQSLTGAPTRSARSTRTAAAPTTTRSPRTSPTWTASTSRSSGPAGS